MKISLISVKVSISQLVLFFNHPNFPERCSVRLVTKSWVIFVKTVWFLLLPGGGGIYNKIHIMAHKSKCFIPNHLEIASDMYYEPVHIFCEISVNTYNTFFYYEFF